MSWWKDIIVNLIVNLIINKIKQQEDNPKDE